MFDNVRGADTTLHNHRSLGAIPGLQYITGELWNQALADSELVSFPAGASLVQCGEPSTHFIIVLKGVVRVYQSADSGKEICLYRVCSGQVCVLTLARLLKSGEIYAQAVADEDVTVLAMPLKHFYHLLAESEEFRNYVMNAMANCLTEVMQMVANVSFQRLELRLACLIGKLSQSRASKKLHLTHQEVANELGTTREVISRILKDFEHMGCIKLRRGRIEILSGETLQKISG